MSIQPSPRFLNRPIKIVKWAFKGIVPYFSPTKMFYVAIRDVRFTSTPADGRI